MKRALLVLGTASSLAACAPATAPAPTKVEVTDAVCRPTAPGVRTTGCYVALTSSRNDRLISVSSPVARQIQIHEMTNANGVMRMAEMPDGLPLPAGEETRFQPGGYHMMLVGPSTALTAGGSIPLVLTFETAPAQEVQFRIGQPETSAGGDHAGH